MSDKTGIEWCESTWNPIVGCSRISEGCRHCYAERGAHRIESMGGKGGEKYRGLTVLSTKGEPRWTGEVRFHEPALDQPLRWRRPRRIFVNAMSDLFHESVPYEWIDRIFAVMADARQHTFQILTKRPDRMLAYLTDHQCRVRIAQWWKGNHRGPVDDRTIWLRTWPLPNVWLGVSVEDQAAADERIPILLQTPAAVRWISAEPLLGPVDLTRLRPRGTTWLDCLKGREHFGLGVSAGETHLDWVVIGGESGPGARPMHPAWVRSLRDQCAMVGVPFLFKQWGEWEVYVAKPGCDLGGEMRADRVRIVRPNREPDGCFRHRDVLMCRVGKRRSGRLLDGRTWDEYPEVKA